MKNIALSTCHTGPFLYEVVKLHTAEICSIPVSLRHTNMSSNRYLLISVACTLICDTFKTAHCSLLLPDQSVNIHCIKKITLSYKVFDVY